MKGHITINGHPACTHQIFRYVEATGGLPLYCEYPHITHARHAAKRYRTAGLAKKITVVPGPCPIHNQGRA